MAKLNDLIYHFSNDGLNINVEIRPLVKCKECKYAKDENFISAIWCENLEKYLAYDFFCADGERRTE